MAATARVGRLEGKVCIVTGAGSSRGIGYTQTFAYDAFHPDYAV